MAYPTARVLGANERIRLAIIGVGLRGQELLKQTLTLPSAQVVAVADVYTRRFDEARKISPGLQTVNDYRRILDMKDIDGVLVATPLHIHARHFLDTLAARKDLYSEKTMTWSIAEAEQCLEASRKSDRVLQIGLQHESEGPLTDARKWIADGNGGQGDSGRILDEPQQPSR
jgi:predicted dehydrogenase